MIYFSKIKTFREEKIEFTNFIKKSQMTSLYDNVMIMGDLNIDIDITKDTSNYSLDLYGTFSLESVRTSKICFKETTETCYFVVILFYIERK